MQNCWLLCTSLCHPGHTCTNNKKATTHEVDIDCDEIDAGSTSSSHSNVWLNCCWIVLTKWHKDILLSCNSWIYDYIINASQYLIKKENPTCRGLQSTQLAVRFQMEIQKGGFVQVINKSHWIAVSSMNCQQSTIKVYDSFHGYLPEDTKKLIADIMQSPCPKIEAQYIDVQKQKGQSDCGLFAIAFATSLAHLQDPMIRLK